MLELLKSRRSIRKYLPQEVEQEKLETILTAALLSPSSRSRRPWEFIVVRDKEKLSYLSQCREHSSQFLAGAPLGIVVVGDPAACDVWVEDCSIAAIIIQLTAHTLGLGSCWVQVRERFSPNQDKAENYIKQALNIPQEKHVECIIAIGYPGEDKKPYSESELAKEKVHYDLY